MAESVWRVYSPKDGNSQKVEIGPLQLHLQWVSNEVWVAWRHTSWPAVDDKPATLNWSRWALMNEEAEIELIPTMPPRPLLFKPESPYRLLPGSKTKIYTRIPLWIKVRTAKRNHSLTEIPSVKQSNTWFGTPADGELCYSHYSSVRRFVSDDFFLPHLVGTVLEVYNASDHKLNFEKICLRTDTLSIFMAEGHLWADAVTVKYEGSAGEGEFKTSGRPPVEAVQPQLLSGPRVPRSSNVVVRTFDLIRDIRIF